MHSLPSPVPSFNGRKEKILQQLAVPESLYSDASPKGSVDVAIRSLIDEINSANGFVTTSSCAGRVSVFLEGQRTLGDQDASDRGAQVAGVGGKGGGGTWLFVSHDVLSDQPKDWSRDFCLDEAGGDPSANDGGPETRFIHFKFEPMILHILTTSESHAQLVLGCGLQAGFRESGIINILPARGNDTATPMVAIRSMGLSFESLIGHQIRGQRQTLVTPEYLQVLVHYANERFAENSKRIQRFRKAFLEALGATGPRRNPEGEEWEDPAARRDRMRVEGLKRKQQLDKQKEKQEPGVTDQEVSDIGLS